ncbi:response regulator transcription factor [Flavilitoribacter nigricans]|uniref:DNA-binding response regulator n=1 Tax=Flavilitoribacter nigricans (strain ATCC 23147 / DSM 23189 / NBRC 102662 / NCIMB 1420 / SS-2) TaxID=1122177 RepID=A0A2D0NBU8_FLAN2|nr:response regulator transcription factor [Flavilitoribacter nigricans]PHN05981.1 DNA-binding response regulator [Flavilitoribacter nigricans DSM 23189 = NBRC 102662]
MINLAIAEDEALFRKGMIALLEGEPDLRICFEAGDGQELLQKLKSADLLPDILLLDLKMPKLNGIEVAKIIREEYPSLRIIVLSTYFSKAFIINMIELGAGAYLPKNATPDQVISSIHEVYQKGFSYDQAVMEVIRDNMIHKTRPKADLQTGYDITARESEVLQLICEEYTTPEIAERLYISPRTVDGHRNNLLQKLGCRNVAGLVVFALQHQLVTIRPETFWFRKG